VNARLEAIALDFGYRGHPVGRGVTLSLRDGEIVCLLGPNGGGKSTFFRTLLGLLPAQGGRVRLDGEDLATMARAAIARRVSYVPQAHAGFFPYTVRDVVLMGRTAHLGPFAVPSRRDHEVATGALARLRLDHLAEADYTRISGGERQLTLIARAIAQAAPLVVMDEPTASLDFGNQVRVLDEVRALARGGCGVLMATHDPDQAFLCADRVALIGSGRLLADAPPDEAVTPAAMRVLYGVDVVLRDVEVDAGSGRTRRICVPVGP
jgi:iron complex transport system ATP-binding protein